MSDVGQMRVYEVTANAAAAIAARRPQPPS